MGAQTTEERKKQAVAIAQQASGWTDLVCKDCQEKITAAMRPVQKGLNSNSRFKQTWAMVQMGRLQNQLWHKMCPKCLKVLKQKVGAPQ